MYDARTSICWRGKKSTRSSNEYMELMKPREKRLASDGYEWMDGKYE